MVYTSKQMKYINDESCGADKMVSKNTRKLKSNSWRIIITILISVIVVLGPLSFGERAFGIVISIVAGMAALVHLLLSLRTRNWGHLVVMLFYSFLSLVFQRYFPSELRLVFSLGAGVFFFLMMYVLFTKKINWRYEEILELAARPIKKTEDGFTHRPFPAGETQYTGNEIMDFAKFLLKNIIAIPYYEDNRVIMVIPANMFRHLLYLRKDYLEDTYVSFDFEGSVSVHIAQKDYLRYEDEWTFDQLCQSLGDVFKRFLRAHQKGEGHTIIAQLNDINVG